MASAPTSARVRAIIFFIDWILPRPKCANRGAHLRHWPSLPEGGLRAKPGTQLFPFRPRPPIRAESGRGRHSAEREEARGAVSASAPVIAYVINARTGQETPTVLCLIREIGGRSAGNADEVALCRHPPGQCQGKTV